MRTIFPLVTFVTVMSASVVAQGLETRESKNDWEEINFEFNSSVLSDGYPSLLRLAELLSKNPGYHVRIEGHTDESVPRAPTRNSGSPEPLPSAISS